MNAGLTKVGTNQLGGATIVLQKVSEAQKESEFSMLTSPSFQSIIGATQKRREGPEWCSTVSSDGIPDIAIPVVDENRVT
ncbi:hypothetical protein MSSD14B_41820 [Marinobacter salsuginis]|uniref:Uncharacterized protein n=1 Tax=Marinobacter salsuginis TaxID=418719 RepID=A0A5M3Q660_9GAMM|nr:hypothetical protein MSSD14B_41820 [Marinobacter salsuginis]